MSRVFLLIFSLGLAAGSAAAQRDYCFKNDGLKLQQTVSFTLTGARLEGTFESGGYDQNTSAETFEFTGTKHGSLLTIKFQGRLPYELPKGSRGIVWTIQAKKLRIPMYGKNYTTNKYSNYTAAFTATCKDI